MVGIDLYVFSLQCVPAASLPADLDMDFRALKSSIDGGPEDESVETARTIARDSMQASQGHWWPLVMEVHGDNKTASMGVILAEKLPGGWQPPAICFSSRG